MKNTQILITNKFASFPASKDFFYCRPLNFCGAVHGKNDALFYSTDGDNDKDNNIKTQKHLLQIDDDFYYSLTYLDN